MIDLNDLYNSFQSYVNTFVGGFFRPQTDFTQRCNDISKQLWVKWTREAEKSQEAKDNLLPFLKSKNMIVLSKGVYGTFQPPKDYGRFSTARIIVANNNCYPDKNIDGGKCDNGDFKTQEEITEEYFNSIKQTKVDMIDNGKWAAVNEHLTKGPTLGSPKMRQIDGGFEVSPRKVSVIVLDYYVEPNLATFVYTISPVLFIDSSDFESDGVSYINTNLVSSKIALFWNDTNRFVYSVDEDAAQIEFQYLPGGGFEILIPGFNANTTSYHFYILLRGQNS